MVPSEAVPPGVVKGRETERILLCVLSHTWDADETSVLDLEMNSLVGQTQASSFPMETPRQIDGWVKGAMC